MPSFREANTFDGVEQWTDSCVDLDSRMYTQQDNNYLSSSGQYGNCRTQDRVSS